MSTKHTPGPWKMETVRTSCGVCHKIGPWPHEWRHGKEMSACIYDDYPSRPEGTDTMLANARLIAAAPDLLDVARLLRDYLEKFAQNDYGEPNHEDILLGAVDAAIAKAEGR